MTKLDFGLLFWLAELIISCIVFQEQSCVCCYWEKKPPSCAQGQGAQWERGCWWLQDGAAAMLEVLLMKYLDSVSISVLFEDRLGKIAQFITSLKGNCFTSVFLK